jgi:Carboxypeptidase regulatory-like domain
MRGFAAAAVLFVFAVAPLAGQSRPLTGTVKDDQGRPLPGAVVRMVNMNAPRDVHSAVANGRGAYEFSAVPYATEYELQAKYAGVTGGPRHLSEYDWRPSPRINLRVHINPPKKKHWWSWW